MRSRWWLILMGVWVSLSGCPPEGPTSGSPSDTATAVVRIDPNAPPSQSPETPGRGVFSIQLQIGTVEIPEGMASGSEDLWSYLDEEPLALRSLVLGLNGFRVGIGREDSWQEVGAILKKLTGRQFRTSTLQTFINRPTNVSIRRAMPIQTIFFYDADQTLSGRDFPAGENLITFAFSFDEDHREKTILSALPQIRSARKEKQYRMINGVPTFVSLPKLFALPEVGFQVALGKDDFLVIGPGAQARRPSSVGNHFLTTLREGVPFETVLILRAKVTRLATP